MVVLDWHQEKLNPYGQGKKSKISIRSKNISDHLRSYGPGIPVPIPYRLYVIGSPENVKSVNPKAFNLSCLFVCATSLNNTVNNNCQKIIKSELEMRPYGILPIHSIFCTLITCF